jgi:ABC-2 type transport system ATP-binding protein
MSTPAIAVEGLKRHFGTIPAVDGVSFAIETGRVVGFVGANGAGKTTTMRILATLDYPSEGRASVLGHDVVLYPGEVRRRLGWVPDSFGTYENMTTLEYLDFHARALGFRGADRIGRIREVVEFTDLGALSERMISTMSKGQSQRLCLARALIHDPEVLIMDEPAAGLDPRARVDLKRLIRILSGEGKTILISSHILSELGEMCDSLLFIDRGRIVHHGTAESLTRAEEQVTLVAVETLDGPAALVQWALTAPYVKLEEERRQGCLLRIGSADAAVVAAVLRRMIADGIAVTDFHREERSLEEVFVDMMARMERGEPVSFSSPCPETKSPGTGAVDPGPGGEVREP